MKLFDSLLVVFCTKKSLAAARYVASLILSKFLFPATEKKSNVKVKQ